MATAIAAIATAALVLSRSYVAGDFEAIASPNRYFFAVLDGRSRQLLADLWLPSGGANIVLAVGCLLAPALAVALVRRGRTGLTIGAFGVGMAVLLAAQLVYVLPRVVAEHNGLAQLYFGRAAMTSRDWVDQRVTSTTAAVEGVINSRAEVPVWYTFANAAVWWELEFWNRSVDRVYRFGDRTGDDLTLAPIEPLSLNYASGALHARERQPPRQLVLSSTDVRFAPEHRGSPVSHGDLTLYRMSLPYRADWASKNIREDGWTEARHDAVVRLYARRDRPSEVRRLRIVLHGGADVGGPRRYTSQALACDARAWSRDNSSDHIDVCVPAGGHADVGLAVHGATRLSPRIGRGTAGAARPTARRPAAAAAPP